MTLCQIFSNYFTFLCQFFFHRLPHSVSTPQFSSKYTFISSEWAVVLWVGVNCARIVIPNCLENSMIQMAPQPPTREPHSHHRPDQLFCCDLLPGIVRLTCCRYLHNLFQNHVSSQRNSVSNSYKTRFVFNIKRFRMLFDRIFKLK
jgi:hypothetical protein